MITKPQLRQNIFLKRRGLDIQWLKDASAEIEKNISCLDPFTAAETVALYMGISGEVSLDTLFSSCWNLGQRTCIPVFNNETKLYEMAEVTRKTRFKIGRYGIKEPINPLLVSEQEIDLMILPGVAFDSHGNRVGRGGGYYDRLLVKFSGITIGVAFDFQVYHQIPTEPHDKPVDFIVTETKTVEV
ncbi:MAG: 5-formyltetrahydrofolate cyclo-ligase [Pontiella sp.]